MQAKLNLDLVLFFDAVSGEVQFVKPSRQLALSCSNFTLESGSMLSAICLKKNGRLKKDTIDLNQHLGFEGETLRLGRTGFREAGVKGDESFWLDGLNLCGNFTGPLTHKGNLIVETCVDLAIHLENDDGKLVWKDEQNFLGHLFGRDGVIVQYLEPLPVIGLLTAFIHRIAGNDDEAGRAFVKSTGASIVYAGCLILSIVTVNPVGLGLIAAFLTPVAIKAEEHIANHTIGDVAIRDSIKRAANDYLKEIIINSLAAGGAGPWLVRKIRNQRQAFEQEAKTLLDQSTKEVLGDYVSGNLSAAYVALSPFHPSPNATIHPTPKLTLFYILSEL
ncbi:hypothetical protein EYC84_006318 [Monilinia fructicola]|uniref:Cyanovirin-N domain-containing protein n=1 Tax=Monilinia fructicola TaxID=38448 RepID=A0A5M9K6G4_MONFR|nr:hypothetical protein EYC84_006318 [Monilinia fructicola]